MGEAVAATSGASRLADWRRRGRWVEAAGQRLFVVEAGPEGAPRLLLLHGFPTCSYDFVHALPELARRYRVTVHDHLGFGLSDKPRRHRYSLASQAEAAADLWRRLGIERGHLVAHDYGTSVATELLARRERGELPLELESVTLSNGSVLLELARLRLSQRLMRHPATGPLFVRLVGRRFFKARLARLFARPEAVDGDDLDALWLALAGDGGRLRLPAISGYLDERVRFRRRWVGALERLDRPCHLLWGRHDPVAVPAIAERLAAMVPRARLTWLEESGHFPMLERPHEWSAELLRFVDSARGVSRGEGAGPQR